MLELTEEKGEVEEVEVRRRLMASFTESFLALVAASSRAPAPDLESKRKIEHARKVGRVRIERWPLERLRHFRIDGHRSFDRRV